MQLRVITEAARIWEQPAEMIAMWDDCDSKLAAELQTMSWVGSGKVVDLGCGPGRFANYINPECYVGYDGSPAMIDIAKSIHPMHTFAIADIFQFQINTTFDVVLLHDVAQHQNEPVEALIRVLTLWRAKRYIFSLLVGDKREDLLNSTVVSLSELLVGIYKPYNVTRTHIDKLTNDNLFTRLLIEVTI